MGKWNLEDFEEIAGRMTPEQVRWSRDSVTVRLYDDGGVNGYKFFTKKCSSNLSLISSVFTAERMTNKSRGTRSHFITYLFLLYVPLFYLIFVYFRINVYSYK
jgi:hypothetical protein